MFRDFSSLVTYPVPTNLSFLGKADINTKVVKATLLEALPQKKPVEFGAQKAKRFRRRKVYDSYCEICQVDFFSKKAEVNHLKGSKHRRELEMIQLENNAQEASSSSKCSGC